MQEFFYTVLAIWVTWKLFNVFSSSRKQTSERYYQANHQHNHYHQKNRSDSDREGDVTIQETKSDRKSKSDSDMEYTDYEEIK